MKWDELSVEQKNALVAEKVMGWKAGICDGEIGEKPNSPDGWYCLKCGDSGYWGDDMQHEEIPPNYSIDMNAAIDIVNHFTVPVEILKGYDFTCKISAVLADEEASYGISKNLAEAICKAALRAVGVEIISSFCSRLNKKEGN